MSKMNHANALPKLKAAGCPDDCCDKIKELEDAGTPIDYAVLIQMLITYGPQVLALILALLGKGPVPSPMPTLQAAGAKP